jgi:photosystem II stability/assembly factor-like uncharacterized protein
MKSWYAAVAALCLLLAPRTVSAQPSQWEAAGMGGGGALFLPSFDPHSSSDLYLSCDMSEIFHSTDLGASWSVPSFRQVGGGSTIGRICFTSDPMVLYTISRNGDAAEPRRSTDGGATWKPFADDPTGSDAWSIWTDPARTTRVILTSYDAAFVSNDGGASFTSFDQNPGGPGYYIAGAFFDGDAIYLGTSVGLVVSVDGGTTFSRKALNGIPAAETMVSFTGARAGATTRFYCVTLGSGDVYPGVTGADYDTYKSIYTLDLGDGSWARRTSGIPSGIYPFFVSTSLDDPNTAYIAGGSDADAPVVYKTTNGGAAWTSVLITASNGNVGTGWSGDGGDRGWSYGEYALGFTVDPTDRNRAMITDLGFVHLTTDGGATWREVYTDPADANPAGAKTPQGKSYRSNGLENTSAWQIAWADSATLFISYSDIRGTRSTDAGGSWSQNYTGHTQNSMYYVAVHPTTGTLYGATSSVHDMYQSTRLADNTIDAGTGQVLFSNDKGHTWQVLHDFGHPVIWLALDPAHPNRLYASVIHSTQGGIYVSSDIDKGAASTWTKLAAPPRTEGHPFNIRVLNDGALVASYSGRRTSNFTESSGIFMSTNGGTSWQDRSAPAMHYWTKDVVIDPHDASQSTWYAGVFSGWGGAANDLGGLYRTTDRGTTWAKILDLDRVTSCTVGPMDRNTMYVTTEVDGLWYTQDLGSAQPLFTQVDSYTFRQPERVFFDPYHPGDVWVTSFGNGLRRGHVQTVPQLAAPVLVSPANGGFGEITIGTGPRFLWETVPSAAQYELQISSRSDFSSILVDSTGTTAANEIDLPFPSPLLDSGDSVFYWRVRAISGATLGAWSEIWSFTTRLISDGVREASPDEPHVLSVRCSPNRTGGEVMFVIAAAHRDHATLRIVDMLGNVRAVVFSGELDAGERRIPWSTQTLPSGAYWYELESGGARSAGKLEIIR